jgi:hypothetical protein
MSLNRATPEQILAAAKIDLAKTVKRLLACQIRLYRETGTYPDDLAVVIQRLEFLLHGIMAGLVTPTQAKTESTKPDHEEQEAACQDHAEGEYLFPDLFPDGAARPGLHIPHIVQGPLQLSEYTGRPK